MKTHTLLARSPSFVALLGAAKNNSHKPLQIVEKLDVQRYLGRWYEIARFQHRFERSLVGVTAEYIPLKGGRIQVINSGFKNDLKGPYREARGLAWVPDPRKSAALKVRFFWPFAGNYLVFGLDQKDYSWALVGDNSRRYLWFLARSPQISAELFAKMKQIASGQGYDLTNLYTVAQKLR